MWNQAIKTPLGPMHARWSERGLYHFSFLEVSESVDQPFDSLPEKLRDASEELAKRIEDFFETGQLSWPTKWIDWSDVSAFDQVVLKLCMKIPSGKTMTYGQLAERAGSPLAARAVGGCMGRNRWPLLIPCHRVVGSSGKLTGYSGRGGTDTKRWLLEHERHNKLEQLSTT
jgi:methylated-DNA-[protein]-cysteine S-methyltransferase